MVVPTALGSCCTLWAGTVTPDWGCWGLWDEREQQGSTSHIDSCPNPCKQYPSLQDTHTLLRHPSHPAVDAECTVVHSLYPPRQALLPALALELYTQRQTRRVKDRWWSVLDNKTLQYIYLDTFIISLTCGVYDARPLAPVISLQSNNSNFIRLTRSKCAQIKTHGSIYQVSIWGGVV